MITAPTSPSLLAWVFAGRGVSRLHLIGGQNQVCRGDVGGKRHVVHITSAHQCLDVGVVRVLVERIDKEEHRMHIAGNDLRGNLRIAAQRSAEHAFHRQTGFILDEFAGGAGADQVELRQGLPILYGEGDHVGLFAVMSDDCDGSDIAHCDVDVGVLQDSTCSSKETRRNHQVRARACSACFLPPRLHPKLSRRNKLSRTIGHNCSSGLISERARSYLLRQYSYCLSFNRKPCRTSSRNPALTVSTPIALRFAPSTVSTRARTS